MKSACKKSILGLVIVLLCLLAAILWASYVRKASDQTKETPESVSKDEPAERTKIVLRSSLAGRWYPADPQTLTQQIDGFFQKANVEPTSDVIALILPHAGYRFSGQTAALGIKTADASYKRIVVIGPSHSAYMDEMVSVPRATHYETPLGQIPLDVEFIEKLLQHSIFQNLPHAHKYEHSVQIELPLLQFSRKDFRLVPIVAGRCSPETVAKVGAILKGLIDAQTLVVASSDFVHYGPNYRYVPFEKDIPEQIKKLDMGAYDYIAALDSKGLLEYKQSTGATICGCIPVAILLSMLDKPAKARLMGYETSGEIMGDFTNSVSYLSVAFSGRWQNRPEVKPNPRNHELTEQDKEQLLTLARKSIAYALENLQRPSESQLGCTISDIMKCPHAAFVTLKKHSQLRGCIGDIFPRQPLYKSIINNAVNAAFNDKRFNPIKKEELDELTIEISALTSPEPVGSSDKIRIGIDGVVLNKDGRSAVFLPQVAPEQGWDLNQMLTRLSLKAGLPADAWKEGANFLVFQAVVFGEKEK